jgi:uncharacterized membrane protein YcaP (DUF421 family)
VAQHDGVFVPSVPIWEIFVRTVIVYVAVLLLLRTAGKRELGQMSVADLVVILVIANAVQNAMNGGDNSLTGGLVAAATLVAMNLVLGRIGRRVPYFGHFFRDEPTLLMQDGKPLEKNMEHEHVDREDIEMAAREHGIASLADVSEAILEPDGSISIIPNEGGKVHRSHRQLRQFRQR